jgi:hypothetical protein
MSRAPGQAEGQTPKPGKVDSSQDAARRFGRKLLGAGGGQVRFDGPIRIEKDESGLEQARFCLKNGGLEPKRATVLAGASRSPVGVLDPGEKKCSSVDVSRLSGHPAGQLRIQEQGLW